MASRKNTDNHCWVCIISHGLFHRREIELFFCDDLPVFLRKVEEATLIYFRRFTTMVDGLGHLTILRTLSTSEQNAIIRQMNPRMDDVSPELIRQMEENKARQTVGAYTNLPFHQKQ